MHPRFCLRKPHFVRISVQGLKYIKALGDKRTGKVDAGMVDAGTVEAGMVDAGMADAGTFGSSRNVVHHSH